MRTSLAVGIAIGAAALSFGGGYVVATVPRAGEVAKMRDDLRTLAQYVQTDVPGTTTHTDLVSVILDMNARWNSRTR